MYSIWCISKSNLFIWYFIAVKVKPRSIKHEFDDSNPDCSSKTPLEIPSEKLRSDQTMDVVYTYSVHFHVSSVIFMCNLKYTLINHWQKYF